METRSRIALQLTEDSFLSVYHHWDGYPQWLGVVLNKKFNTREKVAELLDGGDISCIESDNNWKREKVENHVLYYNARGEDTEPRLDLTIEDYLENGEEYAYVYTLDHQWECYDLHKGVNKVEIPAQHPSELST